MSRARCWKITALAGVLLVLGLGLGARHFLSSRRAADRVADQLRQLFRVPVRIGAADIGLANGSSLGNVEVFEDTDDSDAKPWIAVREIEADVGAAALLAQEATPTALTLRGLAARLHFDRDGHLLTRLPPLNGGVFRDTPTVRIDDGQLTLQQDDRPALVVRGIRARGKSAEGQFVLNGEIDDPYWGQWRAKVNVDPSTGAAVLELASAKAVVTQAMLQAIPFIPPRVWKQVQASGVTPVKFTLRMQLTAGGPTRFRYRVELKPRDTSVRIAAIQLDADQARGSVVVEDNLVELREVTGRTADGTIRCDADLDFRSKPSRLDFRLAVRDLDVTKLPPSWTIAFLQGRLTGDAHLQLMNREGKIETGGGGAGTLTGVQLGILKLAPVNLRLRPDKGGYRLEPALPVSPTTGISRLPAGKPAG